MAKAPGKPGRSWQRPSTPAPLWKPGETARHIRGEAGRKLVAYLVHQHPGLSARAVKRLLESGRCRVNGRIETFASRILAKGDVVEFAAPASRDEEGGRGGLAEHVFEQRRVVHDDGDLIAYDKPAGWPVTPTDGSKSWSLLDILRVRFPGLIPVHRLDADTSGVVLFARTPRLARALEALFAAHAPKKEYVAIVRGHPRDAGTHRSYLVKVDSGPGHERWKSGRGADARQAETRFEVEERLGTYGSRVRVFPSTGRYHQIRIHFSEMGHPIYGDLVHGDRADPIPVTRHLLHAEKLSLMHPFTKAELVLRARVPREFAAAETQLREL